MKKSEIELIQTCGACPEQYEAYYKDQQVGYLRLRHGYFSVSCNTPGGIEVYSAYPNGDGIFEGDEREYHLNQAKKAIRDYHNHKENVNQN